MGWDRNMRSTGWVPWEGQWGRNMGSTGWDPWDRNMGSMGWVPWEGQWDRNMGSWSWSLVLDLVLAPGYHRSWCWPWVLALVLTLILVLGPGPDRVSIFQKFRKFWIFLKSGKFRKILIFWKFRKFQKKTQKRELLHCSSLNSCYFWRKFKVLPCSTLNFLKNQ